MKVKVAKQEKHIVEEVVDAGDIILVNGSSAFLITQVSGDVHKLISLSTGNRRSDDTFRRGTPFADLVNSHFNYFEKHNVQLIKKGKYELELSF